MKLTGHRNSQQSSHAQPGRSDPTHSILVRPPIPNMSSPCICGSLNLAHDIITFAEEGKPLAQHGLVFVIQVIPFRDAIFGFEGGCREGAGGVFACKDCLIPRVSLGGPDLGQFMFEGGDGGAPLTNRDIVLLSHKRRCLIRRRWCL